MKCEWVQENILLYVYNELADDARYELEQHVARCADCAAELKASRKFNAVISQFPVEEPPANLLAASRMRLQEALETAEQGGFWQRLTFDPGAWMRQVRFSPTLAAVIFIVGFAGGIGAAYKIVGGSGHPSPIALTSPNQPVEASISGISSVTQEPGSNQISIKYQTVSTQEAQGSLNDQRIQQLLLFAARNNYNSGVRMDSVDLLTQKPDDTHVREVLMYGLRYDANPGVRLKALGALGPYVKNDVRVRDAVLESLQALHLLEPVSADSSVRVVLQKLAQNDQSPYIRSQARLVLAQLPEID